MSSIFFFSVLLSLVSTNFIHSLPIRLTFSSLICLTAIISQILRIPKGKKRQNREIYRDAITEKEDEADHLTPVMEVDLQSDECKQNIKDVLQFIKGKTQVLPVLSEQLHSVIQMTDDAAMQIILSFQKISKQSRKLLIDMKDVFNLFPDDEITEEENILAYIKNTLSFLKDELNSIRADFRKNHDGTNHVYNEINNTQEIIDRTNEITEHMKVLSINASVVSARSGSEGKVFAVISREFQKLAEESEGSNKNIERIIKAIIELAGDSSIHSEKLLNEIDKTSESVISNFTDIIAKVDWLIHESRDKLHVLTMDTEILTSEIKKIIMSIQFQDISRQRIEHVINPINEMYSDMKNMVMHYDLSSGKDDEIIKDELEKLENSYTMADEKILLQKVLNNAPEGMNEQKNTYS